MTRLPAVGAAIAAGLCVFLLSTVAPAHDLPLDPGAIEQRVNYYGARLGGPATYPAYARLGLTLLDKAKLTGDWTFHDEAMRYLATSLEYQTNYEALLGLARGHADAHRFPEALRYAEEVFRANPDAASSLATLFDIRLALGQEAEAAALLERLRRVDHGFGTFARAAALDEARGRPAEAIEALQRGTNSLVTAPGQANLRAWFFVREGVLRLASGQAEAARACYQRALELKPADWHAQEKLAAWHAAQGHWAEARDRFAELVATHPTPGRRLGLAEAMRKVGDPNAAKSEEHRALEELRQLTRSGRVDQLRPLALFLLESDRSDELAEGMRWAQRDAGLRQDVQTLDVLAWAHWRNHQTNEAVRLTEQITAADWANPLILLHRGLIECSTGRKASGVPRLRAALTHSAAFGPHERRLEPEARTQLATSPEHVRETTTRARRQSNESSAR